MCNFVSETNNSTYYNLVTSHNLPVPVSIRQSIPISYDCRKVTSISGINHSAKFFMIATNAGVQNEHCRSCCVLLRETTIKRQRALINAIQSLRWRTCLDLGREIKNNTLFVVIGGHWLVERVIKNISLPNGEIQLVFLDVIHFGTVAEGSDHFITCLLRL